MKSNNLLQQYYERTFSGDDPAFENLPADYLTSLRKSPGFFFFALNIAMEELRLAVKEFGAQIKKQFPNVIN